MDWAPVSLIRWLFDSQRGPTDRLLPRWLFLRALGLIYFSAFFSLIFQIRGLIGPVGILPAGEYLQSVANSLGHARFWYAPTLLWLSSSSRMLLGLCWAGMAASLLLVLNLWPRGMLVACFVCFLSFIGAASDFSSYQSDGMLLEAGFIALFFAPPGFRPGWGRAHPPSRASLFLLQYEWFRIYFESGAVKLLSGEPQWRHLTAMDEYYQNGPLPTWIGWYAQQLPHWFHASTAFATLALELGLVWMLFLPRRWRPICFFIVTPWQIGIILTANYTFLNYIVLALGFLLLEDRFLLRFLPQRWVNSFIQGATPTAPSQPAHAPGWRESLRRSFAALRLAAVRSRIKLSLVSVMLAWIFYATTAQMIWLFRVGWFLPSAPVAALEPFRIANRYGLFAVMTRGRYEIEFQGSDDAKNWVPYPFRFKPQDVTKPPGIYAPYQPRFDWNLWFASLGPWRESPVVLHTELRLLSGEPDVLALFAGDPFPHAPRRPGESGLRPGSTGPRYVRAVLWQYWFTSWAGKRTEGLWWRRELLGLYAPALEREPDGRFIVLEWPTDLPPHE